jgi:hypothetical protein
MKCNTGVLEAMKNLPDLLEVKNHFKKRNNYMAAIKLFGPFLIYIANNSQFIRDRFSKMTGYLLQFLAMNLSVNIDKTEERPKPNLDKEWYSDRVSLAKKLA